MSNKVLDTNIILHNPDVLYEDSVQIPFVVLQELDKLKSDKDKELAWEARKAIRAIKELDTPIDYRYSATYENNDDIILKCAKDNDAVLYTKDFCLALKAKAAGIVTEDPYVESNEVYTGIKTVVLEEEKLAEMYQNMEDNLFDLFPNQYLLVKNTKGITVDKLKWSNNKLSMLKLPPPKVMKPWNDKQAFALDLLNDNSVPIKIIAGTYGSGKTMLSARMGIYHLLQKGSFSKITLIRNPIGSGQEIGFIKGDKDQKIEPFYKPIEQNLEGGEIQLRQLILYKQLEFEIPFYIKGQSISNSWMIVEECEDMDKKLIKLIGTRMAEGSVCCFSGDWRQAEARYSRDNGLVHLLNQTKSNKLTGAVVLDTDVRSDASRVFAELD